MFNNKSETTTSYAGGTTGGSEVAGEANKPEISISMPGADADRAKASNSIIDEWLTMTGDLESEGDILVKGTIRGNIRCKLLIIDEKASVEGGMTAEEVVIRGSTQGTIRSNRVILEGTAQVDGEIFHRSFAVEEGARIEGALHHQSDPLSTSAAEDKTVKAEQQTVSPAATATATDAASTKANGSASVN